MLSIFLLIFQLETTFDAQRRITNQCVLAQFILNERITRLEYYTQYISKLD